MAVADELCRAGLSAVVLPSDQAIRTWGVEVSDAETADARQIIDALGLP